MMESLAEQFGTAAEFDDPKGGIFLWVKLPDVVDTQKLAQAALAAGVSINPGFEWSPDKPYGKSRLRLCFGHPSHAEIREGIAVLADVCRREFGNSKRPLSVSSVCAAILGIRRMSRAAVSSTPKFAQPPARKKNTIRARSSAARS
jgi:hypothetical protein